MNHTCTVQQSIEDLLSDTFGTEISITGCGRTDAGVHASQYYFYCGLPVELPANFLQFMNKKLPRDISFLEVIPVPANAHVCIDATKRTYDYFFHDFPDPWLSQTSGRFDLSDFDSKKMIGVLTTLIGQHDFRQFCLTPDRQKSTVVNVSDVVLFTNAEHNRFRIQFEADRFIRGMIRVLVHDLLLVGTGEWLASDFSAILGSKERASQVRLAPREGLFLTGVSYPYIDREPDLPLSGQCEWQRVVE